MPLQDAFSLTPRNSYLYSGSGHYAKMDVHGISHYRQQYAAYRYSFNHQHDSDELSFAYRAGDAAADYTAFTERDRAPHVYLYYNLSDFTPHKEVALTFRFDAITESRIQIYTDAGLLDEEILNPGDDQFLLEVESTSALNLYFIHVNRDGSNYGGNWFFRGIDGYIA